MTPKFTWERLDRLDEAIGWRRDLANESLAHVWHLETVAELAGVIRALMSVDETDRRLISVLWRRVPGDERDAVIAELQQLGTPSPDAAHRLFEIVSAEE